MQFFRKLIFLLVLAFAIQAKASDLLETIITREYGSCETNNLRFSAMKFYKIPLSSPEHNLFLRALFFFNDDGTFRLRLTWQELLGCQPLPSGETACSYRPLADKWLSGYFQIKDEQVIDSTYAQITRLSNDVNRGFTILFKATSETDLDLDNSYIGGMVATNFDQHGRNTINICRN